MSEPSTTDDGTVLNVTYYANDESIPSPPVFTEEASNAIYLEWTGESKYETNSIRAEMPIASKADDAADTAKVVTLANPVSRRIFRLRAKRATEAPSIPAPADTFTDDNGIKYTLLDTKLVLGAPEPSANLRNNYRVDVQYIYSMSRAPKIGEDTLRSALNVWSLLTPDQNPYPADMFSEATP